MDWLKRMKPVIEYIRVVREPKRTEGSRFPNNSIEKKLTEPIQYGSLSRIAGCPVSEFSRIFSFRKKGEFLTTTQPLSLKHRSSQWVYLYRHTRF